MRLIDADKIYPDCMTKDGKLAISQTQLANAPTVETGEVYMTGVDYNLYIEGYKDGKRDFEPKQGEWVRKEDVIHSIAQQYSAHNELVPFWLSIGDIQSGAKMQKGGAENDVQ